MDRERRDYLLSLDEYAASKLPRQEWYDRTRLLRRKLANEMLERIARERVAPIQEKTSPRASNEPIIMYNHWTKD